MQSRIERIEELTMAYNYSPLTYRPCSSVLLAASCVICVAKVVRPMAKAERLNGSVVGVRYAR